MLSKILIFSAIYFSAVTALVLRESRRRKEAHLAMPRTRAERCLVFAGCYAAPVLAPIVLTARAFACLGRMLDRIDSYLPAHPRKKRRLTW